MWFEDEKTPSRRLFGRNARRGNRVMRLNAGGHARGGQRAALAALACAALAATAAVAWVGWTYAGQRLFSRNPAYSIRDLQIAGGDVIAYYIRREKRIVEGSNLFGFDIAALREEFLRQRYAAKYKSVEISRHLPGTLRIEATERVPVAAIADSGGLVVDAGGFVFGTLAGKKGLPIIVGHFGRAPIPGDRIKGNSRDALAALDMWERAGLGRERAILGVDARGGFAGKPEDMRLFLDDQAHVDLWWPRPGSSAQSSSEDLRGRMGMLTRILAHAKQNGKRVKTVNLTLESYTNNNAATYWE